MTVINTNIKALYTQSALKQSERASQAAMEQLSTGKRINSSKDDAAGLAIAARMTQNIKGMNQSIRNAGDAISLIQVVEGATNEITSMLQRMSELAVQSSNSTYSADQRGYLDQEFQQLKEEIVRISETHEWNGFPILNGKAGTPVGYPIATTDARDTISATGKGLALNTGDLVIEVLKSDGKTVKASIAAASAADDTVSSEIATSSSKAASAIAIAAAINKSVGDTGVRATANGAVINATKTVVGATSIQTDLYINGTKIPLSLTTGQTTGERRQYVIDSINSGTTKHGVIAGDGGNGGLSLKTIDGRNLSVWYDNSSGIKGQDFGLGGNGDVASDPDGVTGLASASLTGASALNTTESATITFPTLVAGESYTLNGLKFNATATVTPAKLAAIFSNLTAGMTAAQATTLHSSDLSGLGSYDSTTNFDANSFTTGSVQNSTTVIATATGNGNFGDIAQSAAASSGSRAVATRANLQAFAAGPPVVNQQEKVSFKDIRTGESVTLAGLTFTATSTVTGSELATIFFDKLTSASSSPSLGSFGTTTKSASWALPSGASTPTGASATDLVIQAASTTATTDATSILSSTTSASPTLTAISKTDGTGVFASTVYGTVTLNSNSAFTIRPGDNAYPSGSTAAKDASFTNFTKLGFNAETVNSKNIGRLSFQVGPSPDQLIHIDLADFGQSGDITGPITSDTAPTNILTVQAANDVTQSVNKSLDKIAQTRASMGAVMNRLEHVIDNLTNVVMNSEASRSQIEDADYAKASTELARTQIMQQAATAVLAQANTSQQTVLKLLQA
jgi:flagellin